MVSSEYPAEDLTTRPPEPSQAPAAAATSRQRWLARYIARRLLILVPLAFVATIAAFGLTKLAPGGPIATLLQSHPTSAAQIAAIRSRYHLDDSLLQQYWSWLSGLVHGDLGRSILTNTTVTQTIRSCLGITLVLNIGGILFSVLLGIPLGALAALKRGGVVDRVVVALSILGTSTPTFASGLAMLFLLAFKLRWFPLFGAGVGFSDRLHHLALPTIVLGVHGMGYIMRITRAAMLEQFEQDYVAFARARGLSTTRVVSRHVLRNALIPVVTAAGLLLIGLLTGSVLVEGVFGLPGIGTVLVTSVQGGDFPVIQGLVLIIAAWIIAVNVLVDLLYALVDPRVGFGKALG